MRRMKGAHPLDPGPLRRGILALLLALPLAGALTSVGAQETPVPTLETLVEGPVPAEIGESVAWRLVRDTAEPEGVAEGEVRAAGFGIPEGNEIRTTNTETGEIHDYGPGEAFYVAEDSTTVRESLSDEAVPYLRLGLVDADDADDAGGDELVLAGEPFDLRPERDDLLLRLEAGTVDARPATIDQVWPSLLIVTEGTVTLLPEETGVTLTAGEAVVLEGTYSPNLSGIVAEGGEARVLLARIVAADDPNTGYTVWPGDGVRVTFTVSACPEGSSVVDLGENTGGAGPPPCRTAADGKNVEPEILPGADVLLLDEGTSEVYTATTDDDGVAAYTDLSPSRYSVTVTGANAMTSRCQITELGDPAGQLTPEYTPNIALGPVDLTTGQVLSCMLFID
jgi:hypothetical protein